MASITTFCHTWCPSKQPRRSGFSSTPCQLHSRVAASQCSVELRSQLRPGREFGAGRRCRRTRSKQLRNLIVLSSKTPPRSLDQRPEEANIGIRSEVEAPFRALRLVLFGFFAVSASVGALIAVTQVIGALGGARNALPLEDVAQSLGIDLAAAGTFAFFLRRDLQARDKQIARLTREERLGALPLSLANGRRVKVGQLRSFSRVVIAAGSPAQVAEAVAAAEPLREQLQERGVLVVPIPIFPGEENASENGAESSGASSSSGDSKDDLRWKATPLRLEEWKAWFDEQTALAGGTSLSRGLYISLRLDGRVRGSGQGPPPWQRLIAQLAPLEGDGAWKGFFDGFDGRV